MNMLAVLLLSLVLVVVAWVWLKKFEFVLNTQPKPAFYFKNPMMVFYSLILLAYSIIFLLSNNIDMLVSVNIIQIIVPLLIAGILMIWPRWYVVILAALVTSFLVPLEVINQYYALPYIVNKLIVFTILFAMTWAYKYSNAMEGCAFLYSIGLGMGFFVLFMLGALPSLYGYFGLVFVALSAVFFYFNKNPCRINIKPSGLMFVGFLGAWISLLCAGEAMLPAALVLNTVFVISILQALALKLFYRNSIIAENVFYYKAFDKEIANYDIYNFLFKAYVVLILLATISLYSPNLFSVPVFAVVVAGWFMYRLLHIYEPRASLKSIFVDMKQLYGSKKDDK